MTKTLGIIPSRYNSERFPGKPLVDINGKTMIRRVYERASEARLLDELIVATDDSRIYDEVKSFGGKVEMTSRYHQNGTERCAEIAAKETEFDYVINIQGDEPFIHAEQIDTLVNLLEGDTQIASLVRPEQDLRVINDPANIKVVFDQKLQALYFSRSPIPFHRSKDDDTIFYQHIGLYGFKRSVLLDLSQLPPGELELAERLEQLRWMEHGYTIKLGITYQSGVSIDTPEQLQNLLASL